LGADEPAKDRAHGRQGGRGGNICPEGLRPTEIGQRKRGQVWDKKTKTAPIGRKRGGNESSGKGEESPPRRGKKRQAQLKTLEKLMRDDRQKGGDKSASLIQNQKKQGENKKEKNLREKFNGVDDAQRRIDELSKKGDVYLIITSGKKGCVNRKGGPLESQPLFVWGKESPHGEKRGEKKSG